MVAYFQLQPPEMELQQLAEQYWREIGEKDQNLEKEAFEAGEAIRHKAEFTLKNLEAIVRWKSERSVHYLIRNSDEMIRRALTIAASPESSTEVAVKAFWSSMAWIFPWRRPFWQRSILSAIRCSITAHLKRWATRHTTCTSTRSI